MITAPSDIRCALPSRIARTLATDRYFDFPNSAEDDRWRARSVSRIESGITETRTRLESWSGESGFLRVLLEHWKDWAGSDRCHMLKAKPTSRILVNLGGTALENGGLCLDRVSGLPFIPGSAVKGIARREAITRLALAPADSKCDLLFNIALCFGWSSEDWSDHRDHAGVPISDFAWASGNAWQTLQEQAKKNLAEHLQLDYFPDSFRGLVCFLPAYPDSDPGVEQDIVTSHHREYYGNERKMATDDENPIPVVFSAIRPAGVWTFPLLARPEAPSMLLDQTREFLAASLQIGIGAKTNAGYGRFQAISPDEKAKPIEVAQEFGFTFVTPCMCAGAKQEKAELRISSLRGSLRWWFRALGGQPDEEKEVFGGIGDSPRSSAVSIELRSIQRGAPTWQETNLRDKQGRPVRFLQRQNDAGSYIWHFAAVSGDERRMWSQDRRTGLPNAQGVLPPQTRFILVRRMRRKLSGEVQPKFDLAWRAFCIFGAVGLRSTRAMGCWTPEKSMDVNTVTGELRKAGFLVNISNRKFGSWQQALAEIEKWLKYKLRKDNPVGGDADGKNQNPSPLGSANPCQGSSLQFRILKVGHFQFIPVAFEAPAARILGQRARRQRPILTPDILCSPAPQLPPRSFGGHSRRRRQS